MTTELPTMPPGAVTSMDLLGAHQLINQTSGNVEYYTPAEIIEAAWRTLGVIDLDPASSVLANERVKATRIYTEADDGLAQEWNGNVWMNHPFGRIQNPKWIAKIEAEYRTGRMLEACCITFACTSEQWFQPLLRRPQCYLSPRTNYLLPDGGVLRGVTKGSVVTYYGNHTERFATAFSTLGVVKVTYAPNSDYQTPV